MKFLAGFLMCWGFGFFIVDVTCGALGLMPLWFALLNAAIVLGQGIYGLILFRDEF